MEEVQAALAVRLAIAAGARSDQLATADFSSALEELEWIAAPPATATRPSTLRRHAALHPLLHGTPFSTYLAVENFYQGYIVSSSDEAIDEMGRLLYPGIAPPLTPAERYIVLLWASSLKASYTQLFPDLFHTSADNFAPPPDQREVMDAQIRALTGGDITKTAAVLAADTLTALTELNAKAREAREMSEHLKDKKQ